MYIYYSSVVPGPSFHRDCPTKMAFPQLLGSSPSQKFSAISSMKKGFSLKINLAKLFLTFSFLRKWKKILSYHFKTNSQLGNFCPILSNFLLILAAPGVAAKGKRKTATSDYFHTYFPHCKPSPFGKQFCSANTAVFTSYTTFQSN
jgi:hypothetical protein